MVDRDVHRLYVPLSTANVDWIYLAPGLVAGCNPDLLFFHNISKAGVADSGILPLSRTLYQHQAPALSS